MTNAIDEGLAVIKINPEARMIKPRIYFIQVNSYFFALMICELII
jgi:hypothetical protein